MEAFSTLQNSVLGRYGVATSDLEAGDFLSDEYPFVIGPKPSTTCCCLECFVPIDATSSGSRCENCYWPLCVDCKKLRMLVSHTRECEIFKAAKQKFYNLSEPNAVCIQLDCITPLRVLLQKEASPGRWASELEPMEHHREHRLNSPTWKVDEQNIVLYLLHGIKLKLPGADAEMIQQVIGILEINSFEGRTAKGHSIRCLFPKLAILAHSCTPNILHSIHPSEGYKFHIRATKAVKKDEQLFTCYTFTLSGTAKRQKHLLRGKFFQCRCERCLDPTELGTNFSTLKCQKCHSGDVITSDPLDLNAVWKCNKCPFEDSTENVKRLLKALQEEIDSTKSVDSLESLLDKYKSVLHPNHFVMISIKNALIDSYGHLKGHLLSELPDALLSRKIELCKEVLDILNVFEGGKSRARGLMLFELYAPIVAYAKSRYQMGNLKRKSYLKQLKGARNLLKESLEILSWEDENVCKSLKMAKFSMFTLKNLIEIAKDVG